ncbi:hypothetical protein PYV02_14720 [Leifsonia sp. H3M29-4]|jgi:hypothetical protein|uniref:hypothetical protein n=1 Tax=Salinibacterium metalliresistens TaxID=3031321 RepID=UPI0023D9BF6A|nr:hypothetical protein [Salinibacterium metalliresistens]MDF1480336.1 hypothetical protein [Salinibacterium metalliresistens]
MAEQDGVDEEISNALRTGLMAASRIGDQVARLRENQLRHAEARSAQEARELQNRLDSERLAARAELAVVDRPEWWSGADAADITAAWQTATSWRAIDPEMERKAQHIEREVQSRWDLDMANTGARPDQVREHLQRILALHGAAEHEISQQKRLEREAVELLLEADALQSSRDAGYVDDIPADEAREDQLRDRADALQGDAVAHELAAARLLADADEEVRQAKTTSDKGQAYPPRAATVDAGRKARRPRRVGTDVAQERSVSR